MVREQIESRGVRDARVLEAMREVPREAFVPSGLTASAYEDGPLPIGEGQTISQPYIVAMMVEALNPRPGERALEIGAGSGYAAAVLGRLAGEVEAVEVHGSLARSAARRVAELEYDNVRVHHADGTEGWPARAPYDAILVSACGREVPGPLLEQLAAGGRMVIPIGDGPSGQELLRVTRRPDGGLGRERLGGVRFVPLGGAGGESGGSASV
mgnify:CR=1 FL=1